MPSQLKKIPAPLPQGLVKKIQNFVPGEPLALQPCETLKPLGIFFYIKILLMRFSPFPKFQIV